MSLRRKAASRGNADLIEGFIRSPDVEKHHEIVIQAPANIVFDVAEHFDLHSISTIRVLFRLREFLLFIRPRPRPKLKALASETAHLGWIWLCHAPGRHLVMGAVAQPWVGDVEFKAMSPEAFITFADSDSSRLPGRSRRRHWNEGPRFFVRRLACWPRIRSPRGFSLLGLRRPVRGTNPYSRGVEGRSVARRDGARPESVRRRSSTASCPSHLPPTFLTVLRLFRASILSRCQFVSLRSLVVFPNVSSSSV